RGKLRPAYHVKRLKVWPDGHSERFDGRARLRAHDDTQVLRLVPSRAGARVEAARGVFSRYATEVVSFFQLAAWLNDTLGIRNSFGGTFQSNDIQKMLSNEAYIGYPSYGKRRRGKYYRIDNGVAVKLEASLYGKETASAEGNR